ncbi:MAG TPA: DUF1598 domain-containing protein [Thermoanaerobaculia bacterium]|nr:DUF1598 domain-containing protein [Thermoanaerobaculia bacterium]
MNYKAMLIAALFFLGTVGCSAPEEHDAPGPSVDAADASSGLKGHLDREEPGSPDLPLRAVSLRALQQTLAACAPRGDCPEETLLFGKLTQVLGYTLDPENRDVLVYGLADPGLPQIHVEDFVVALRSSWLKYAEMKGDTLVYTHPGCDIRPEPALVLKLHDVSRQFHGSSSPGETEAAIKNWQQTCGQPQEVSVLGIPFDTRFAHVMVIADYDMKRLADGSDSLDLPGLESMMDMELRSVEDALRQQRPVGLKAGMNRFWLTPGDQLYEEADGITWLSSGPVHIRTHAIGADASGELGDTAGSDPTAEDFAHRFSVLYDKVAEQRPIYRELRTLFQIYALTQVLRFRGAPDEVGLDLAYFLESHPLAPTPVKRQVPGRHRVKRFRNERQVPGGTEIIQFWMPSCGGVEMSIEPANEQFRRGRSDLLPGLREGAVGGRPRSLPVAWNVSLSPVLRKAIKNSRELQKLNRPGSPLVVRVEDQGSGYQASTDRIGDLYQGLDAGALTSQIGERLAAEPGESRTVFLQMQGFSEDKAEAFILESRLRLAQQHPDFEVRAVHNVAGKAVEEMLFSPGTSLTRDPEPARPDKRGEAEGYATSVSLAVRVRNKIHQVTLHIWSASKEVVDAFVARIKVHFADSGSLAMSVAEVIELTRREIRRDFGERANDLQVEIEEEFDKRHLVDLTRSRDEGSA